MATPRPANESLQRLLQEVRACTICTARLPLPPRPECAATWRARLLAQLPSIRLTLAIGTYAQAWHLTPAGTGANPTATVAAWREHGARVLPLPPPSPRNNGWLRRNPWFEAEVLPELKARVRALQGRQRPGRRAASGGLALDPDRVPGRRATRSAPARTGAAPCAAAT